MSFALYAAASGMAAQQRSLEVTAENLSNLTTPGYRPLRPGCADALGRAAAPGAPAAAVGVAATGVRRLVTQGALHPTGDGFDLALDGPGLFRLQRPDGSEVYTRAGHFHPDGLGRLLDAAGAVLLGENGPLSLPPGAQGLHVDAGGNAVATLPGGGEGRLGRISLATFTDPGALLSGGDGQLVATAEAGQQRTGTPGSDGLGRVHQGFLEDSGVDLMQEMNNLLQAQRLYELNSRALQAADEIWQVTNNLRR